MKFLLSAIGILVATSAMAQQQPQMPSQDNIISACQAQRNWAMDQHALSAATVTGLNAEIAKLKSELEGLKAAGNAVKKE